MTEPVPHRSAGSGELLPCPFCGSAIGLPFPNLRDSDEDDGCPVSCWTIQHTCTVTKGTIWAEGDERSDCVSAWNARAVMPAPAQTVGMPDAWIVDGPLPLDSSEVFLTHEKALEAFNDWGKRITPLYKVMNALAAQPPAAPVETITPHSYVPNYQAMGDCRVCGHGPDAAHHRSSAGSVKERCAALAERFWSIHPREIQDMGITREEFYAAEIEKLVAALITSEPQEAPVSQADSPEPRQGVVLNGRYVELTGLALEVMQSMDKSAARDRKAAFADGRRGGLHYARSVCGELKSGTVREVIDHLERELARPLPAYSDPNFEYRPETGSYHRIAEGGA